MSGADAYDRRVVLLRASKASSALNEPVKTWRPLGPINGVRCRWTPIRDAERLRAQQIGASVTDRFEIRWATAWADLSPEDQLDFEGKTYGIVAVKPIGRRRGLDITAVAKAERAQ